MFFYTVVINIKKHQYILLNLHVSTKKLMIFLEKLWWRGITEDFEERSGRPKIINYIFL